MLDGREETIRMMVCYMKLASPSWWEGYKAQRARARTYREIADDFDGEEFAAIRAKAAQVADHNEALEKAIGRAYWEVYYWLSGISKTLVRGLPKPGFDPENIDAGNVSRLVMHGLCTASKKLHLSQSQWSDVVNTHYSENEIPI